MYYEHFSPFYGTFLNPLFYEEERVQENEFLKMRGYYPEIADQIQEEAEKECAILDYEGSRIYDEYPDRLMLKELAAGIRKRMESEQQDKYKESRYLDELIEVVLYQEIIRRRCRHQRCRKVYY